MCRKVSVKRTIIIVLFCGLAVTISFVSFPSPQLSNFFSSNRLSQRSLIDSLLNRTEEILEFTNSLSKDVGKNEPDSALPDAGALFKAAGKCLLETKRHIAEFLKNTHEKDETSGLSPSGDLKPDCEPGLLLIILLTTRPGSFANRAAIRLSWGRMDSEINRLIRTGWKRKQLTWKTIFAIGVQKVPEIGMLIEEEYKNFKDILRLSYEDTYNNLPNKTMLSLGWIADHCKPKFVLKTDDDCFVNIFHILPWLDTLPLSYQYMGRVNIHMPVIRDPFHRNYVPRKEHPEDEYKPYCAGGGYILAGAIIKNVTERAKTIKQIINEDAYMGMITNSLKVKPRNEERFLPYIFFGPPIKKLGICDYKSQFLIHNVFGRRQLIMHWNNIAAEKYTSICEKL